VAAAAVEMLVAVATGAAPRVTEPPQRAMAMMPPAQWAAVQPRRPAVVLPTESAVV
jgi:hypothetical protein